MVNLVCNNLGCKVNKKYLLYTNKVQNYTEN